MNRSPIQRPGWFRGVTGGGLALALVLGPAGFVPLAADTLQGGAFSLNGSVTGGGGVAGADRFSLQGTIGLATPDTARGGPFELTGGLFGLVLVPGDVELQVEVRSDGTALLTWPGEASGFLLESASQLGPSADWRPLDPAAVDNSFVAPTDGPLRFFRLRKP